MNDIHGLDGATHDSPWLPTSAVVQFEDHAALVNHLLTCHRHHFAVVEEQTALAVNEMVIHCQELRGRRGTAEDPVMLTGVPSVAEIAPYAHVHHAVTGACYKNFFGPKCSAQIQGKSRAEQSATGRNRP